MSTLSQRWRHVQSPTTRFVACAIVGIVMAILTASEPCAGDAAGPSTTNSWESSPQAYPALGPWRRTRDGWQILDPNLQKPERSTVSRAVMLLHPIVGASLMALISVFSLVAFDRDFEL